MDKVHYELEVFRNDLNQWRYNQRQPTLEKAEEHFRIVSANTGPSDIFGDTRIVEVRTTRKVIKTG